ncbi:MAG: selenium cofactor biosynthesis protein YqeC, partial [Treponema sp.]|nr:selenium cofactor biosynthesis protein YqeC [Treponema sp.]
LQNPAPGITLAGNYNKASGKLEPLLPDDLEKIYSAYDLVLIEGDGAKGLPLKAWSNYEPVVPAFSDFTIGILPLINMGEPVSEKIIHRLPLFLDLSGAAEGEPIKKEHLVKIITGGTQGGRTLPGLFSRAKGKKILFFNQAEDDAAIKNAIKIAESLPPDFRKDLYAISAGSIKLNNLINLFSEETR